MVCLADTSIWIDYMRTGSGGDAAAMEGLLRRAEVVICGPVAAEILSGVHERERESLWTTLLSLPWAALSVDAWREVGQASYDLAREGMSVPLTDIIIAVAAARADVSVWTLDRDFKRLAGVIESLRLYESG